jgi:hypothetical protein
MSATIIIVASFGIGVAFWLLPASINITSWSRAGLGRIATFAPLYLFWAALGGSALLAAAIWFAGERSQAPRARRAQAIAPAAALWLWAIPFLPWLGERFPLVLILAGPLRWLIAAAALAAIARRVVRDAGWGARLGGVNAPGARARILVFVLSLAFYLVCGFRSLAIVGLGGDEPHYLVATESLLKDHDLKVENNYAQGDYRSFSLADLRPDFLERGVNGEIYSIHAPGLSALVLPGYALFGARGAVATACLLAALAALAIFDVALLVGGAGAAWATWGSLCFSVPIVPHAWSLYPEIAGAAIVAWGVAWAVERQPAGAAAWFGRGVCVAILPWLHTKFVVILAVMGLWLLFELRTRAKEAIAFAVPIAVSSIAWFTFFYVIYGTIDPQAPYGAHAQQFVRLVNLPRSVLGLLADQKFGLFVYAPIYLATAAGGWLLLQDGRRRAFAIGLVAVLLAYFASSARYYMWWGGSSAPARFLVPLVPLLAPMVAAAFAVGRGAAARAILWTFATAGVLISLVAIAGPDPWVLFSDPHGTARLLEMVQGSVPLTAVVPTFTDENWRTPFLHLVPWIGAAIVALGLLLFAGRRVASPFWPALAGAATFLAVVTLATGSVSAEARAESATRGRFALMQAFDPSRLRAFDYAGVSRMSPAQWLEQSALAIDLDPSRPADGYVGPPLTLAPGQYDVKVWFQGNRALDGDLLVTFDRAQILKRVTAPLANPTTFTIDLPVAVPLVWIQVTDHATAQQAARLEVTPTNIIAASQRPAEEVHAVDAVPGQEDAYLVYTDAGTFPEGGVFWTNGTRTGRVLVVPAHGREIRLTLHLGPVGGTVRVTAGREPRREDVVIEPEGTRTIAIAVGDGTRFVPVTVQAPVSFRPAEVDPSSSDTRDLGCQVRVEVQ